MSKFTDYFPTSGGGGGTGGASAVNTYASFHVNDGNGIFPLTENYVPSTGVYTPGNGDDVYLKTGKLILQGTDYTGASITAETTTLSGRTGAIPYRTRTGAGAVNPPTYSSSIRSSIEKLVYGNGQYYRIDWIDDTSTATLRRGNITTRNGKAVEWTATPLTLTGTTWTEGTPISILSTEATGYIQSATDPAGFNLGTGTGTNIVRILDVSWDAFNNRWLVVLQNQTNVVLDLDLSFYYLDANFRNATTPQVVVFRYGAGDAGSYDTETPVVFAIDPRNGNTLCTMRSTNSTLGTYINYLYISGGTPSGNHFQQNISAEHQIDSQGHAYRYAKNTSQLDKTTNPIATSGAPGVLTSDIFAYFTIPATVPGYGGGISFDASAINVNSLQIRLGTNRESFNIADVTNSDTSGVTSDLPQVGDPTIRTYAPTTTNSGFSGALTQTVFLKIK